MADKEDLNPYRIAQRQTDEAARFLPHLDPGLIEFLKKPDRLTTVEFPIASSDGEVHHRPLAGRRGRW